jgi:hypothetical protein
MLLTTRGCIPFDASCSTFAAISVRRAISETSSNGQTEGQINRCRAVLNAEILERAISWLCILNLRQALQLI